MATFSELYPQYYNDEYQATGQVPAQYANMPEPPRDVMGELAIQNAPMMQAQQQADPFAFRQPAPLSWWEQLVNPTGARTANLQAAQRFNTGQLHMQAIQTNTAAQRAQVEMNFQRAIEAQEPGQRKPQIDAYGRWLESIGVPLPKTYMDFLNKAEQQDLATARLTNQILAKQFPEIDPIEIAKYFFGNPAGEAKWWATYAQIQKAQQETTTKKIENELLQRELQQPAVPATPGPTAGPQPLAPAAPPLPTNPLKQSAFESKVDTIGKRMRASPHVLAMVKSSAAIETAGYNPEAESPKHALGTMQFMPETAKKYGVKNPKNDEDAIEGAIKYYTDLDKMFPGQPQLQFASYNAGEGAVQEAGNKIPPFPETLQYVQKGLRQYSQLLGGRPATEATLNAPPETQAKIAQLNQAIAAGRQALAARTGITMSPRLKPVWDAQEKVLKSLEAERNALIDQTAPKAADLSVQAATALGLPANPAMWKPGDAEQVHALEARWKAEAVEEEAKRREPSQINVAKATNVNRLVEDVNNFADPHGNPPPYGVSSDQLFKKNEAYAKEHPGQTYWTQLSPLPTAQQTKLDSLTTTYNITGQLVKRLEDPEIRKELAPVIGNIFSDPEAWYTRIVGGKVKGLTPTQQRYAAGLAFQAVALHKEFLGTAQTKQELQTADPFIADMAEATPDVIHAKLQGVMDAAYLAHQAIRNNAIALKQKTPPALPEPPEFAATSKQPPTLPKESFTSQSVLPSTTKKPTLGERMRKEAQ